MAGSSVRLCGLRIHKERGRGTEPIGGRGTEPIGGRGTEPIGG